MLNLINIFVVGLTYKYNVLDFLDGQYLCIRFSPQGPTLLESPTPHNPGVIPSPNPRPIPMDIDNPRPQPLPYESNNMVSNGSIFFTILSLLFIFPHKSTRPGFLVLSYSLTKLIILFLFRVDLFYFLHLAPVYIIRRGDILAISICLCSQTSQHLILLNFQLFRFSKFARCVQ